jgi:hypothetical protein
MSEYNDDNEEVISNKKVITQLSLKRRRGNGVTLTSRPPHPGARGAITRIFREIVKFVTVDMGYNLGMMMDIHLRKENQHSAKVFTQEQVVQERGNLIKEINSEKMTWASFCKMIRLFPFVRMDVCLRFYDARDNFHDFHTSVNLREVDEEEMEAAKTSNINEVSK